MRVVSGGDGGDQPVQRPRFGPIREVPPPAVLQALSGTESESGWTYEQFGAAGGFPNGGIWRVRPSRAHGDGPATAWVKRTGPAYLGTSRAWRCRYESDDPNWLGREAAFYGSELATSGWADGVRAARCYAVDDHDDTRDLWLEAVSLPATLPTCVRAVAGLAQWQVAHQNAKHGWLSEDWIPTHVRRQAMDNQRTLAHPVWPLAIERGLDPEVRRAVRERVTDPEQVRQRLAEFPRALTHFDFHDNNVGTVGDEVVLIDWAYPGWGPIGHDAGHLALTLESEPTLDFRQAWNAIQAAYCEALIEAGWPGDEQIVRRSMTVSNVLRLGWAVDELLDNVEQLSEEAFEMEKARIELLFSMF